jgi:hypothetical protein
MAQTVSVRFCTLQRVQPLSVRAPERPSEGHFGPLVAAELTLVKMS